MNNSPLFHHLTKELSPQKQSVLKVSEEEIEADPHELDPLPQEDVPTLGDLSSQGHRRTMTSHGLLFSLLTQLSLTKDPTNIPSSSRLHRRAHTNPF